jgi:hypothetical protein
MVVEIKAINGRYIDAYVCVSPNEPQWHLTCVYGELRVENHHRMWDALRALRLESDLPWLIMGDFNELLWPEEHLSCTPRPTGKMEAFREVLSDCSLVDLGFVGVRFTFNNKRQGRANVKVCLEGAVATSCSRDL